MEVQEGRRQLLWVGVTMEVQVRTQANDSQNSVGSQKISIACSGWKDLVSSPASVSGDSLTREVRQLYHPKPLAQQSEANTMGRGLEGTR